jgi:hypothetical protein
MTYILFSDGTEIGEIYEWQLTERPAIKKMVLGKEIGVQKPNDECQFVSPKPVKWKSKLWLISSDNVKLVLADLNIKHGTMITASVSERIKI